MSASDLHLSATTPDVACSETKPLTPPVAPIDWHALRLAGHACCCGARPAVAVIMPSAAGRPHPTDLLLCGHHYRLSQMTLAGAGAAVFTVTGTAVADGDRWTVGADPDRRA